MDEALFVHHNGFLHGRDAPNVGQKESGTLSNERDFLSLLTRCLSAKYSCGHVNLVAYEQH